MPPIITLLTDFGEADSYVAEMKATVLRSVPDVRFVDVTHSVAPGDILAAQYLLDRSWSRFPPGSIHLVVVDPGVGTERRAIAGRNTAHWFVAPDNGLLTPVLRGASVVALPVSDDAAPTFHGRDVFAPAAAKIASGVPLEELGDPISDPVILSLPSPTAEGDCVAGAVVYVDRFGTLITNIAAEHVDSGDRVEVDGADVGEVRRTFYDVESGEPVALTGSGGTLEVAVRDGSAVMSFGAHVGSKVTVQKESRSRRSEV